MKRNWYEQPDKLKPVTELDEEILKKVQLINHTHKQTYLQWILTIIVVAH